MTHCLNQSAIYLFNHWCQVSSFRLSDVRLRRLLAGTSASPACAQMYHLQQWCDVIKNAYWGELAREFWTLQAEVVVALTRAKRTRNHPGPPISFHPTRSLNTIRSLTSASFRLIISRTFVSFDSHLPVPVASFHTGYDSGLLWHRPVNSSAQTRQRDLCTVE